MGIKQQLLKANKQLTAYLNHTCFFVIKRNENP